MRAALVAGAGGGLGGCGVGPEAGRLARQERALLAAVPTDDGAVRAALTAQADAWSALQDQLAHKTLGGAPVGEDFRAVVDDVAQLARRQRALIAAGQDDPATNRAVLERLSKLWADVNAYLSP